MAIFTDVLQDVTKNGRKLPTNEYKEFGHHPIIDQGQNDIAGYTDETNGLFSDVPAIIFGDHTRVIKYVDVPFFIGADGVKILKAKGNKANYKFLYYALSSAKIPNTGYNRHFKWLKEVDIPTYTEREQSQIVSELDRITALIDLRTEQLNKLDQLVKSRFIELFGGADYPKVLFENVCVFLRNGASIKQTKGAGGYPITRIETLSNDVFNIDRLGYADITDLEKYQSYVLHHGDILISHINSVAYLGRAVQYRGQLDTPIIHGMNLLCARIADSYNPTYIEWFFKTPMAKEYISTITKKAVNQASITTSDLKKMQVPNPPKNLQDQFAAFVEQTDKSKLAVQQSLEKLETLKKSLMQQYFE